METNVFSSRSHFPCHPGLSLLDPFWIPSVKRNIVLGSLSYVLVLILMMAPDIFLQLHIVLSHREGGGGPSHCQHWPPLHRVCLPPPGNKLMNSRKGKVLFSCLLMFAGLELKPRGPNISLLTNSTLKLDQNGPKGEPCLALHESCFSPGL